MSIAAKQQFLKFLTGELGHVLVADQVASVIDAVNRHLSLYEMENAPMSIADVDTEDLIGAFVSAKKLEGRSESTIERYDYVIRRLLEGMNVPIRSVTVYHLRGFLSSEKARGISDRTLEGYRSVFSAFFGWLHSENLIKENPCVNLAPIKCAKKVKTPYTDVDMEKLREKCSSPRDKAIMQMLMSTGCRIGEVCGLNRDDVDAKNFECKVLGKGNKERVVFIDEVTVMLLDRYLETRTDDDPALFVNRLGKRLTPGGVRARLKGLAETANVSNVHPHRFRRTLATNLIGHGMPIQEVAMILGHEKLDTTMTYVYLNKNDVHNSYRKYA